MSASRRREIVAIDGPVGAGKSTVARDLAKALGFSYVSTGAMYRAIALQARDNGISPDDRDVDVKLAPVLRAVSISADGEKVRLDGRDVSGLIADPEISDLASRFSSLRIVREGMKDFQRAAGAAGGVVMEGRDIGTVIFPDAEFKFFLDADVRVRAHRRWQELSAEGKTVSEQEVLDSLKERDARDRERELAPLRAAGDAIVIDATALSASQVVERMKARINEVRKASKDLKRE